MKMINLCTISQSVSVCLDYPTISYSVSAMMLGDDSNSTALVGSGSSNTAVSISGLVPDSRYMYTVIETNEFGNSSVSAPVEICELHYFYHMLLCA